MKPFRFVALWLCILLMMPVASLAAGIIVYPKEGEDRPALGAKGLLELHLINVAGADCILLRMDGHTMMIDSGTARTGARVLHYLASIGVDSLDMAFASHPHDDHIAAFPRYCQALPIGRFLFADLFESYTNPDKEKLLSVLSEKQIPVEIVPNETVMPFGGATLTFRQWQNVDYDINNRSMTTKVQYGERSILLMADVEGRGQRALAAQYGEELQADILKMPHHGLAKLLREMYDVVRPQLATISNFAEDVESVAATARGRGDAVLFTTKGTIVAVTDGETWWVWQTQTEPRP